MRSSKEENDSDSDGKEEALLPKDQPNASPGFWGGQRFNYILQKQCPGSERGLSLILVLNGVLLTKVF